MVEFTSDMISGIIGYIGSLFSDLMTLLLVIFGIALGLWIAESIITKLKAE